MKYRKKPVVIEAVQWFREAMTAPVFTMFRKLLKPTPRGEIRFVSHNEADSLIRSGEWKLAIPEEDDNFTPNAVFIEKILDKP